MAGRNILGLNVNGGHMAMPNNFKTLTGRHFSESVLVRDDIGGIIVFRKIGSVNTTEDNDDRAMTQGVVRDVRKVVGGTGTQGVGICLKAVAPFGNTKCCARFRRTTQLCMGS